MFTKDFIKISQVLDKYGMHKQADDLLRIAQAKPAQKSPVKPATKPAAKPAKPAAPAASPALIVDPTKYNARIKIYTDAIENLKYIDPKTKSTRNKTQIKEQAIYLKDQLNLQYKNNLLDYQSYVSLMTKLGQKAIDQGYLDFDSTPLKPINPTAFPSNINETVQKGRTNIPIELANPVEGVTAAGEKAFSNREDRNLPGLVQEWNNYFDFKKPIEAQIKQMEATLPEDQLKKLNDTLATSTSAVTFKQDLKKIISEFQGKNQPTQQLRQLDATLSQETAKSFEEQLQDRINELKKPGSTADTKDLEALLAKVRSPEGLKAGDFGNQGAASTQIYGVEAKPQTTITGTPTPPAGTPTPPAGTPVAPGTTPPAPPVTPAKPSPSTNPGSR